MELLARTGSHAPDTPEGVNFLVLAPSALNALGRIAFGAALTGGSVDDTSDTGIWVKYADRLHLVVRKRDKIAVANGDSRTIKLVQLTSISGGQGGQSTGLNDAG